MTAETPDLPAGPEQEQPYSEEARASALDTLRQIIGGEPSPELLEATRRRDEEFAARRSHAA